MAESADYKFGDHEARIRALEKNNDEMKAKIDAMYNAMMQGKGGWKTLVAIGGLVAAASGFVGWLTSVLTGHWGAH